MKLKKIVIDGKTYPMKIDMNVLEHIQENYGPVSEWEMDILGLKYEKDSDGKQKYDKDGNAIIRKVEPSIKAIKAVLPEAINEGLAIEAEEFGRVFEPVSEEIIRECNISFELLAKMLHEEFKRCFEIKK